MRTGVLIFDVDNTLYNFVDFFAPSFRSMVHVLARVERVPESEIMRSAKLVYQAAGTLEYPFLVQEMDIFAGRSEAEYTKMIGLLQQAFTKTRRKRLKLYDGVANLITSARAIGWKCVCVTNAPFYQVSRRLRDLGLLGEIDGLVAWEGRPVHQSREDHIRKHSDWRDYVDRRLHFFCIVQTEDLKPSPYPFMRIVERLGESQEFYCVGDSLSKDLSPAKSLGMNTIWAKYGTRVDPINLATLLDVTPWTSDQVAHDSTITVAPDYVAETPRDIAKILHIPIQGDLFTLDAE